MIKDYVGRFYKDFNPTFRLFFSRFGEMDSIHFDTKEQGIKFFNDSDECCPIAVIDSVTGEMIIYDEQLGKDDIVADIFKFMVVTVLSRIGKVVDS